MNFVLTTLYRRKVVIAFCVVALVAVTAAFCVVVTPRYGASAVIAPVASASGESQNLAMLSGIASIAGLGTATPETISEFQKFEQILSSVRLAERLEERYGLLEEIFANEWDEATRSWHPPSGFISTARQTLREMFGLPAWEPPSPRRLAEYFAQNVQITEVDRTAIKKVSFQHPDRDFALRVLLILCKEADDMLREIARADITNTVEYLRSRMGDTDVVEYRASLTNLLSAQERMLMFINTNGAYAADFLDEPAASDVPVFPNVELFLVLAVLGGLFVGIVLALMLDMAAEPAPMPRGRPVPAE
jgi:uncharacterized protein involved in exopolysaccharide biosynthesis